MDSSQANGTWPVTLPTEAEVWEELRVLENQVFQESKLCRDLLAFLVKESLAGNQWKESAVWEAVFPRHSSRIVSIVALDIRNKLKGYYATHPDARIVIQVPLVTRATGYHATFSFARNPEAQENYGLGMEFLRESTLAASKRAATCFRRATELDSHFDLAQAARAEAEFHCAILFAVEPEESTHAALADAMTSAFGPPKADMILRIDDARTAAETAISLNGNLWRAHVVLGAVHACHFDWIQAETAFRTALSIAPEEAGAHALYVAYLVTLDRADEAIGILSKRIVVQPADPFNHALSDLVHHVVNRKQEVHPSDAGTHWLSPIAFNLDRLKLTESISPERREILRDVIALHDVWFHLLGVRHLGQARLKNPSIFLVERIEGSLKEYLDKTIEWSYSNPQPAQMAIAYLALRTMKWQAGVPRRWCVSEPNCRVLPGIAKPWQLASCNQLEDRAVACLKLACDEHDPIMVWLHLWPLLSPLRDNWEFQKLIERMNLPGSRTTIPGSSSD